MFKFNKNGRIAADGWKTLILAEGESPDAVRIPIGPVLVPLSVWRARRAELIYREYEHGWPLGVWLLATEGLEAIARDLDDFSLIAVEFDESTGEKDHSTARLLRERYGYKGELCAIGNSPRARLPYSYLAGVDSFVVHTGKMAEDPPVAPVRSRHAEAAGFQTCGSPVPGMEGVQVTTGP